MENVQHTVRFEDVPNSLDFDTKNKQKYEIFLKIEIFEKEIRKLRKSLLQIMLEK